MLVKPRCTCSTCTCTVNMKLDLFEKDIQLAQFLRGVNEQFTGVRGQILMMKQLPSLSQCYSLLLHEENQRSLLHTSGMASDSMAMFVKPVGTRFSNVSGRTVRRNSQENRDNIVCDYCHMSGHTKDKCYCLHGYPSWHKLFGKPKPKPRLASSNVKISSAAHVSISDSSHDKSSSVPDVSSVSFAGLNESMPLSDDQCKQLIQFLQQSMTNATLKSDSSD